jgi:hypothetical protein
VRTIEFHGGGGLGKEGATEDGTFFCDFCFFFSRQKKKNEKKKKKKKWK